ncbi:hypothetical protein COX24_00575 [bacterium (Candidatus Gribaldobacteria) CG23_combo_of_CG06-09_8_20_14_all_37_87_8]|uniref:Uncharacterized protein n=2 Tax=Candidatus Gribaldobacteria TaxID=2798536 RepID=A0A2G9ZFP8_9BACT|nr:MAG: hypothetical protein AUJ25_01205 [Parcubacteria group bacterium CG1_02_37_13]PIP31995.1 MAG: hypothetical protein COX24_00575 [bacterium (Candidatus Gribaldobacteria) CG23_combo_of_CG06-09_8_20_14_all_37_87_8]PIR89847.1 MAG: hypothetical protein COU05_03865 [bacterium (Candidatus Gribaldobacteria) CG10_big_fil_rev_8_21_14_0_10_37_21]
MVVYEGDKMSDLKEKMQGLLGLAIEYFDKGLLDSEEAQEKLQERVKSFLPCKGELVRGNHFVALRKAT